MAAKHRRLFVHTWRDEKFARLSPIEKLIAIYCFTGQVNRVGIFSFSIALAAEELNLEETFQDNFSKTIQNHPRTFADGFRQVCLAMNWKWDASSKVLYIPTWWKYNHPEGPNSLHGAMKDLAEIPKTHLVQEFASNTTYLDRSFHDQFQKLVQTHLGTVTRPMPQSGAVSGAGTVIPPNPQGGASGDGANKVGRPRKKKVELNYDDPRFSAFWSAYPKKKAKDDACKWFMTNDPSPELLERILRAIAAQRKTEDWIKERGKFIPFPATWLNGRRWEDEVGPPNLFVGVTDDDDPVTAGRKAAEAIKAAAAAEPFAPIILKPRQEVFTDAPS